MQITLIARPMPCEKLWVKVYGQNQSYQYMYLSIFKGMVLIDEGLIRLNILKF